MKKEGADELAILDIAATLENRKSRLEWVKSISSVITIPLTMGGGIASLNDIEMVFDAGAGKLEHFYEVVVQGGAQFLLAASVFHYRLFSIREVKEYLHKKGLQVNL